MSIRKGSKTIGITPPKIGLTLPSDWKLITQWKWNRGGGPALSIFAEGSFPDMYAAASRLTGNYDSISISRKQGDWFHLEAAQNGDTITEIHEVHGTSLSQSIMTNPVLKSQLISSTAGTASPIVDDSTDIGSSTLGFSVVVAKIRAAVNKFLTDQDYNTMKKSVETACGGASPAPLVARQIMDRMCRGIDYFYNVQYTYTHTIIVAERVFIANNGTFEGAYDDVLKVFTEGQLRRSWNDGGESIPDEFRLPKTINGVDGEFLKLSASINLTSGQKRTIVSNYQFADYIDRLMYLEAQ